MYLMIDNYDSFVYNLKAYFEELGRDICVKRCDELTLADIEHMELEGIIEDLEAKIQETEELLCAPENMSNVELLQEKGALLEQYKAELEVQYEEWMELQ